MMSSIRSSGELRTLRGALIGPLWLRHRGMQLRAYVVRNAQLAFDSPEVHEVAAPQRATAPVRCKYVSAPYPDIPSEVRTERARGRRSVRTVVQLFRVKPARHGSSCTPYLAAASLAQLTRADELNARSAFSFPHA